MGPGGGQQDRTVRWAWIALALVVASAALSAVLYWPVFGGDPEIHIIFARNLLRGYPLQFNPGEYTSGETSPLYMVLVAAMDLAVGAYVPLAMKAIGVLGLFALCALLYRAARRQGASPPLALVLGTLPMFFPSLPFQALLGMENMLFAASVVLVLQLWLDGSRGGHVRRALGLALLPLFFLRPETALLGACLATLSIAERDARGLVALGIGATATLAAVLAIEHATGVPLQAPGSLRAAFSRLDGIDLRLFGQPVFLNPKVLQQLAYGAPLAALLAWNRKSVRLTRNEAIILAMLYGLPLLLHLFTVFPSTHVSRYFLYANAALLLVFARGMARVEVRGQPAAGGILVVLVLLGATVVPYEHLARTAMDMNRVEETIAERRPGFVAANSDALYEALGRPPVPVVVAGGEVQLRGRLDDRFVVRSLDGVVDHRMADFVRAGGIDQVGYLKARKVAFLVDIADPHRTPPGFSIGQLAALGPVVKADGLCFRRIDFATPAPAGQAAVYALSPAESC